MGLGRLHDALADHRNTAIIPASRVLSPEPQLASLVGVVATGGSAGAPGPGETACPTSSFPERGPVGPCAAGWIARGQVLEASFTDNPTQPANLCIIRVCRETPQLGAHSGKAIAKPGEKAALGAVRNRAANHFQDVLGRINSHQECGQIG